jgi:type III restriction enzyme
MTDLTLLPFQTRASQQIVNRFAKLVADEERPLQKRSWAVPFYQALSALTGAGKTPILADAVAQMRHFVTGEPIVLWISKARAVVEQTFANFESGGKYGHLIEGFDVRWLLELNDEVIRDDTTPCVALSTVGTFNQKDRGDGTLIVHKERQDDGSKALWTLLGERLGRTTGTRRPLIVVYDEGHNLSDQQTDLLLELEPDAIIVASATMRTPGRLGKLIERLKDCGWSDRALEDDKDDIKASLVTAVNNGDVVRAGLVKRQIELAGYESIMETMIDEMLASMDVAERAAIAQNAGFLPKCIYVSKTNINAEDGSLDQPSKPFRERRAPPILIWRYLVEEKGIEPAAIAVYCDLKFERTTNPPPQDFRLFSGGDQDFSVFQAGSFRHIIFNQALQEGWDDPSCCFAYIDKSMGSSVQVEQVIGRALRQPSATHYPDPVLNTAAFFIRVDNRQDFPKILKAVQAKIAAELPDVKVEGFADRRDRERSRLEPKKSLQVPSVHIDAEEAEKPVAQAVAAVIDFRQPTDDVIGKGEVVKAIQTIGRGDKATVTKGNTPHSNRVMARWILRREIMTLYPEVAAAVDWSEGKFNAAVEITSAAAGQLRRDADSIVDKYLENSDLSTEDGNPFTVGPVSVNPAKAKHYQNALHVAYDLNALEQEIAEEIDLTGHDWCRNPVNGGFSIPLLDKGDTRRFFPDFLVWKDGLVFAIDPKAGMLVQHDAGRKLLNIHDGAGRHKLLVRLIASGKWNEQVQRVGPKGYTVWTLSRAGKLRPRHTANATEAVEAALKT